MPPRSLTASDRSALIRLASALPTGSTERKAILAGLASVHNASTRIRLEDMHVSYPTPRDQARTLGLSRLGWGRIRLRISSASFNTAA